MEQSTDRAQQVIVTSRTLTRPRKQERIQKFRGDLLDAANLLLNEVPVQDVQDILLRTKATADRAFVSEILLHSFAQDARNIVVALIAEPPRRPRSQPQGEIRLQPCCRSVSPRVHGVRHS